MSRFSDIEVFVEIARAGSISGAAARLDLAKSAVSRRLAELEARLGVQLVNRTTRRLSLTDPGAVFYRRAALLIDDLNEAEAEASAGQRELAGRLKIAAPVSFGLRHLRPLLSRFAIDHPRIDLEVDFSDRRVDLVAEGFDLAVRIGELADTSLIARKLCPVRDALAASPEFWARHGAPDHPRDLETMPALRYSLLARPDQIAYWGPGADAGVVSAHVKILASNGDFLSAMARDGLGYIVAPTFFLSDDVASGALEIRLPDFSWSNMNLYAVYPPARQVSARVRAFIDALADRFHHNPYWDEMLRQTGAKERLRK